MLHSRKFYYSLFVVAALYILIVQQFFKNESRFIFQSPTYTSELKYSFNVDFQELNLSINKELVLHGIWFKHKESKALVLFFPDTDIDIRQLKMEENHYYAQGFDVLMVAYRGTAESLGKPNNENDLFSDAQQWYKFAKSQFSENNIILVGSGFGSSVAAQLAGNNMPKALILEKPYFSFGDYQSKHKYWWLPYSYFTSFHLNTWEYVRKTKSEIILIQDETKKDKKGCLTDFLKQSDKVYWLKNSKDVYFSFQADKAIFYNEILHELLYSIESENSTILEIQ